MTHGVCALTTNQAPSKTTWIAGPTAASRQPAAEKPGQRRLHEETEDDPVELTRQGTTIQSAATARGGQRGAVARRAQETAKARADARITGGWTHGSQFRSSYILNASHNPSGHPRSRKSVGLTVRRRPSVCLIRLQPLALAGGGAGQAAGGGAPRRLERMATSGSARTAFAASTRRILSERLRVARSPSSKYTRARKLSLGWKVSP